MFRYFPKISKQDPPIMSISDCVNCSPTRLSPVLPKAGDSKPHSLVADVLSPRPQTLRSQILHGHSASLTTRSSYSTVSGNSRGDEENTAADPLWNWPNGISMARLVSGPVIAYLILDGHWSLALGSLAVSGRSLTQSPLPPPPIHPFSILLEPSHISVSKR